jgi:hypothetical protein
LFNRVAVIVQESETAVDPAQRHPQGSLTAHRCDVDVVTMSKDAPGQDPRVEDRLESARGPDRMHPMSGIAQRFGLAIARDEAILYHV